VIKIISARKYTAMHVTPGSPCTLQRFFGILYKYLFGKYLFPGKLKFNANGNVNTLPVQAGLVFSAVYTGLFFIF